MAEQFYGTDGRLVKRNATTEKLPVFVYGSLKMGGTLNRHIRGFVKDFREDRAVGMERHTGAWFRGVEFDGVNGTLIDGELLYLRDEHYETAIGMMDMMEGTPDLFRRVEITTDGGVRAWAYSYNERLWHSER